MSIEKNKEQLFSEYTGNVKCRQCSDKNHIHTPLECESCKNKEVYIDWYQKLTAKKDYIICSTCISFRIEHYDFLERCKGKNILSTIQERKMVKKVPLVKTWSDDNEKEKEIVGGYYRNGETICEIRERNDNKQDEDIAYLKGNDKECSYCDSQETYYTVHRYNETEPIARFCESHHKEKGDSAEFNGMIFERAEK